VRYRGTTRLIELRASPPHPVLVDTAATGDGSEVVVDVAAEVGAGSSELYPSMGRVGRIARVGQRGGKKPETSKQDAGHRQKAISKSTRIEAELRRDSRAGSRRFGIVRELFCGPRRSPSEERLAAARMSRRRSGRRFRLSGKRGLRSDRPCFVADLNALRSARTSAGDLFWPGTQPGGAGGICDE